MCPRLSAFCAGSIQFFVALQYQTALTLNWLKAFLLKKVKVLKKYLAQKQDCQAATYSAKPNAVLTIEGNLLTL